MIQFLKSSISTGFKLYTTVKKEIIAELSSRQADMQISVHSSEAKQARVRLTHSAKRYHARYSYRLREATIMYSHRSGRNYTRMELSIES